MVVVGAMTALTPPLARADDLLPTVPLHCSATSDAAVSRLLKSGEAEYYDTLESLPEPAKDMLPTTGLFDREGPWRPGPEVTLEVRFDGALRIRNEIILLFHSAERPARTESLAFTLDGNRAEPETQLRASEFPCLASHRLRLRTTGRRG